MVRLAWTAAVSFSALPLRLSFLGAGTMTLVALEEAARAMIAHFSGKTVPGWTSIMVVLCLSNAALMIAVGILGEYIGRIYEEGKGRPLYVVADSWNLSRPLIRSEQSAEQSSGQQDPATSRHVIALSPEAQRAWLESKRRR